MYHTVSCWWNWCKHFDLLLSYSPSFQTAPVSRFLLNLVERTSTRLKFSRFQLVQRILRSSMFHLSNCCFQRFEPLYFQILTFFLVLSHSSTPLSCRSFFSPDVSFLSLILCLRPVSTVSKEWRLVKWRTGRVFRRSFMGFRSRRRRRRVGWWSSVFSIGDRTRTLQKRQP